ncbi:MAG: response regulator [Anaerolineae bacterium]
MPTVLVVDDSPVIRRVMSVTLEKNGYEVLLAEDGLEAIEVLEDLDSGIDIIFADINMPVMDGIAMLKEIRQNENFQHLPVVMLTAVGEERNRDIALREGANTILTKPSSSSEIIATLQQLHNEEVTQYE